MPPETRTPTAVRRAAMVRRLETGGGLTDPRLREAYLSVRREVLLPHAYVRVSGPGADPIGRRLLDGSHPDDREEWLELIHSDESVLLRRDGERLDALVRGPVTGRNMTSMSTYGPATVEALQDMLLEPGQRYPELGPGPGVSLAVVGMGAVEEAPADRIGARPARVAQLAPGGRLLTTLVTRTPSRPGQLLVTRTGAGRLRAVLTGRPRGYRSMLGHRWPSAVGHRARVEEDPGIARPTRLAPPPDDAHGFWLAAASLVGGVVRDFRAGTMTLVSPEDDSWAVSGPGDGTVRVHGPRDVWGEVEDARARWVRAGRPVRYAVDVADAAGPQTVTSGPGPRALTWTLPPLAAVPGRSP
ncbi:methyltransferase [Streptomyces omiyaensis]|uniref:methyltransferase n=1 Tax=Streptomyces omiyaensis TaxID=68247 RepID=UPI0036F8FFE6